MVYARAASASKEGHKIDDIRAILAAASWSNTTWFNVNKPLNVGFSTV